MDFAAITGGMLIGFILILLVSSFFLWLGAKIAGIEDASYAKAIAATFINMIVSAILSSVYVIGWILALVATIAIIKWIFNTDWGKAIIAWIISLVAAFLTGLVLAALGLLTLASMVKGVQAGILTFLA